MNMNMINLKWSCPGGMTIPNPPPLFPPSHSCCFVSTLSARKILSIYKYLEPTQWGYPNIYTSATLLETKSNRVMITSQGPPRYPVEYLSSFWLSGRLLLDSILHSRLAFDLKTPLEWHTGCDVNSGITIFNISAYKNPFPPSI